MKKIVVDFDGTIALTTSTGWTPNIPVIQKINALFDLEYEVTIQTARGSISCKTREDAEKKYRAIIELWLKEHEVNFTRLSFEKRLALFYVDDKALTPDEFKNLQIKKITSGWSGSKIFSDGNKIYKEEPSVERARLVMQWYESVDGVLDIPKFYHYVGNTIELEFIPNTWGLISVLPKHFNLIQSTLDKMKDLEPNGQMTCWQYWKNIIQYIKDSNVPEFVKHMPMPDLIPRTFGHGDFGIKNMLFKGDKLYLIDPLPHAFMSIYIDVAKLLGSMFIHSYYGPTIKSYFDKLTTQNELDKRLIKKLTICEIIRTYKYATKDRKPGLIQAVETAEKTF